jgi:hypothetical protein
MGSLICSHLLLICIKFVISFVCVESMCAFLKAWTKTPTLIMDRGSIKFELQVQLQITNFVIH